MNSVLKKRLTQPEKDNALRMLDGNICRVCVGDDPAEVVSQVGYAVHWLTVLACNHLFELQEKEQAMLKS